MSEAFPPPEPRREVTVGGKFLGLGIFGLGVFAAIMLEKFGGPVWQGRLIWLVLAALALAVVVPRAFFRRVVRY